METKHRRKMQQWNTYQLIFELRDCSYLSHKIYKYMALPLVSIYFTTCERILPFTCKHQQEILSSISASRDVLDHKLTALFAEPQPRSHAPSRYPRKHDQKLYRLTILLSVFTQLLQTTAIKLC
jgi:hypothetical protein